MEDIYSGEQIVFEDDGPKGKAQHGSFRYFVCGFGVTLAVAIFVIGFVTADARGRRLTFADGIPAFRLVSEKSGTTLEIRLAGALFSLDFTKILEFWHFLLDFACIPHN